jgi:hypothetical protein
VASLRKRGLATTGKATLNVPSYVEYGTASVPDVSPKIGREIQQGFTLLRSIIPPNPLCFARRIVHLALCAPRLV